MYVLENELVDVNIKDLETKAKERGVALYVVLDEIVNKELDNRGVAPYSEVLPLPMVLADSLYGQN